MAAVVPSRARAHARPPPDTTHVLRMNLSIQRLIGDVHPHPHRYFFRWMRAGKSAKLTAAKSLDAAGTFGDQMQLYARITQTTHSVTSDDPAEPLDTTIVLLSPTDKNSPERVISQVPFDMAHYILTIAASRQKSMTTTLQMPASIAVTITISLKEIGDKFLHLYAHLRSHQPQTPPHLSSNPSTSSASDMDEAAAAAALEKLRQEVRDRQQRLNSLETSAETLNNSLRQADAMSADVSALQQRVRTLEDQYTQCEREKSDAERKVTAHIAHAAKIRETYNQLAQWYNTLREEHAELQTKLSPSQSHTNSPPQNSLSSSSNPQLATLQTERDHLQKTLEYERRESLSNTSQNSQLLETKNRTLLELREQWEAAKTEHELVRNTSHQNAKALAQVQDTVDQLRQQLQEKDERIEEKNGALSTAETKLQESEVQHQRILEQVRTEASIDEKLSVDSQLDDLKKLHVQQIENITREKDQEREESVAKEIEQLRAQQDAEIQEERTKLKEGLERESNVELERVREELNRQEQDRSAVSTRKIHDLEQTLLTSSRGSAFSEEQKHDLKSQLDSLQKEYDEFKMQSQSSETDKKENHERQLEETILAKDKLGQDIEELRKESSSRVETLQTRAEQSSSRVYEVEEQCESLRQQLIELERQNEEIRTSPRDVNLQRRTTEPEQIAAGLNKQIGELEGMLSVETEKRNEFSNLLATADREHDELREMISRIRKERDTALYELQDRRASARASELRSPAGSQVTGTANKQVHHITVEERDAAIRELFRVRKTMNKTIRQLRKEKEVLMENVESGAGTEGSETLKSRLAEVESEHESAHKELNAVREKLESMRVVLAAERESAAAEVVKKNEISQLLSIKENELAELRLNASELEKSLHASEERSNAKLHLLEEEKQNLRGDLKLSKSDTAKYELDLRNKQEEVARITLLLEDSKQSLANLSQEHEIVSKERDSTRQKASYLGTELESLKESLSAVSSSTSSTESLLRTAQTELAEKKAKLNVLQTEVETSEKSAKEKELSLLAELDSIRAERDESKSGISDREVLVQNLKHQVEEQVSQLEEQKSSKDRELDSKVKLEELVQRLKSRNASLTAKLAGESSGRQGAENRLTETDAFVVSLRRKITELESSDKEHLNDVDKIKERTEALKTRLDGTKIELEMVAKRLESAVSEVDSVNDRLVEAEKAKEKLAADARDAAGKYETTEAKFKSLQNSVRSTEANLIEANRKNERRDTAALKDLTNVNESLRQENGSLISKLETTEKELVHAEDMRNSLMSKEEAAALKASRDKINIECQKLTQTNEVLQQNLHKSREDSDLVRNRRASLEKQMRGLKHELETIHSQLEEASVERDEASAERDEAIAQERISSESTAKRLSDVRREVRSARSVISSQQTELDELRGENAKLVNELSNGSEADVLTDLINTRLELAYAQEEAVRLRNKLTKISPGNRSFED